MMEWLLSLLGVEPSWPSERERPKPQDNEPRLPSVIAGLADLRRRQEVELLERMMRRAK